MSVEFNRVSLPSLAQMLTGLSEPIPVALLSDHDRFPSWELVTERNEDGKRLLLYRCAEGGLRWVHVDRDGLAHRTSAVTDEEARQIWIDHLLFFSEDETVSLENALQPGVIFIEALESALGWKSVMRGVFLPEAQGADIEKKKESIFCADDGGLVSALIGADGCLESSRIIQGREAWDMIQPLIDPDGEEAG